MIPRKLMGDVVEESKPRASGDDPTIEFNTADESW